MPVTPREETEGLQAADFVGRGDTDGRVAAANIDTTADTVAADGGAVTVAKFVASTADLVSAPTKQEFDKPVANPGAKSEKSRGAGPAKALATASKK